MNRLFTAPLTDLEIKQTKLAITQLLTFSAVKNVSLFDAFWIPF